MFLLFYLFDYFNPFTSAHFVNIFNGSNWVRLFNKSLQIKLFAWLFESNVSNPHTTDMQHNVDLIQVINGVNGQHITYFMLHICFGKKSLGNTAISLHTPNFHFGGGGVVLQPTSNPNCQDLPKFSF